MKQWRGSWFPLPAMYHGQGLPRGFADLVTWSGELSALDPFPWRGCLDWYRTSQFDTGLVP